MATWRDIAATEVDADSPVTATLMSALANNPVAIAEGASGAPPLTPAALGSVTAGTVSQIGRAAAQAYAVSGNYFTFGSYQSGTIRFTADIVRAGGGGGDNRLIIDKTDISGTTQVANFLATTSTTTHTQDITIAPGDLFTIKASIAGGGTTTFTNVFLQTDDQPLWAGPGSTLIFTVL